jgi:hypothetical protein
VDNQCTGELTKEDILQKYPDVFEGIGELGESLHLEVDDTVKPVQIPPRRIPEALRKPLKDHLDELEEQVRRTHRMGELSRSQQEEQWENPPLSRPTAFK